MKKGLYKWEHSIWKKQRTRMERKVYRSLLALKIFGGAALAGLLLYGLLLMN